MIVEFCCHLMLLGSAGGWSRHTTDTNADILRILNADDEDSLYTFDRAGNGKYRVWNRDGDLIVEGRSLPDLMAHWELDEGRPPIAANANHR